jgi:hypothetical protein
MDVNESRCQVVAGHVHLSVAAPSGSEPSHPDNPVSADRHITQNPGIAVPIQDAGVSEDDIGRLHRLLRMESRGQDEGSGKDAEDAEP